uniref:Arf-GAP domain-containing protein n=1 Tax=Spongospora subterranea TaxID=70186 RepID=A0A0H5RBK5_9EUKA|eukprot:CRZ11007.1 hypothetical protein [Spongospora subterranea]
MGAPEIEALKRLLKKPENRVCADCSTKQPRWASINIGCFICIRCSGIHRSIGVHISKVRSVTLDEWQPAWVANMENWGNKKVNKLYEAKLGNSKKPDGNAADREMELFIRQKYERKTFMVSASKTEKGKTKSVKEDSSSSEDSSEDDSDSSEESDSDESGDSPEPRMPAKRRENVPATAKHQLDQNRKKQGVKPTSDVDQPSARFADFSSFPSSQPPVASSATVIDDFANFGDFHAGGPSHPEPAKNDKDDIMSLFQQPPPSNQVPTYGNGPPNYPPYTAYPPQNPQGQYMAPQQFYAPDQQQQISGYRLPVSTETAGFPQPQPANYGPPFSGAPLGYPSAAGMPQFAQQPNPPAYQSTQTDQGRQNQQLSQLPNSGGFSGLGDVQSMLNGPVRTNANPFTSPGPSPPTSNKPFGW